MRKDETVNGSGAIGGFLGRLAHDRRGNTLAIVGAALLPLTAMIGSGVDMSRAYMAKTRLQSACDAAALAGRRVMVGDAMSDNVRDEAVRFFNFNFPQGLYQTATFTPQVSRSGVGTIRVTASTTIPTTVMSLFGFTTISLDVECDASQNYVNTDVMLVLDTTGSMLCTPEEGGDCGRSSEISTSRIVALRDATMALYDALAPTQAQLEAAGLRLRYGIVPYSSTVNVGSLIRAVNPNYLVNSMMIQSRVGRYDQVDSYQQTGSSTSTSTETYSSSLTSSQCSQYGANRSYPTLNGAGPHTVSGSQASGTMVTRSYAYRDWGASGTADTGGTTRTCRRTVTQTTTTWIPIYESSRWVMQPVSYDVSSYKLGNPVTIATNRNGTTTTPGDYSLQQMVSAISGEGTQSVTWNGCIEERNTDDGITSSSGLTIPADAYDLNINLIPNSDETRWRPQFTQLVRYRPQNTDWSFDDWGAGQGGCPQGARRLAAWTRSNMQSYVNSLVASGSTYHDIGMIWGTRLLSSGGIFADSPDTFNSMPVTRHIIFMTDGELAPTAAVYSAYGVEYLDQRVTASSWASGQYSRHLQRFRMACNAAKSLNMSVWVIAFGTTLTQDMIDCASNAEQASTATNRQQLIDRFTQIGQNIGALRLTQ